MGAKARRSRKSSSGFLIFLSLVATSSSLLLRQRKKGKLAYDPKEVLCSFKGEVQGWCGDWLDCIKGDAAPSGGTGKVMDAWGPADCEEYCGVHPVTSPLEGQLLQKGRAGLFEASPGQNNATDEAWGPFAVNMLHHGFYRVAGQSSSSRSSSSGSGSNARASSKSAAVRTASAEHKRQEKAAVAALKKLKAAAAKKDPFAMRQFYASFDCSSICRNFQENVADCVSKVLFSPGSVGGLGVEPAEAANEVCNKKDTPCVPKLSITHQQCVSRDVDAFLKGEEFEDADCKKARKDFYECSSCPQMKVSDSEYVSFVGGCKMRLNAYWQATHPKAGRFAVPGATGCKVHSR